ncbi:MAG: ABC transporter substrate-binding protein [Candidatus Thorarchaeota archaeon]|jgi:branched-chain amino acid transport system substrate-binding protein
METKQIAAIAVIVIIVAGVGAYWFLSQPPAGPYGEVVIGTLVTPGAPAGTPSDRIIIVGIIGSITEIQGEGEWKGAYLACDELNQAGGVTIGADTYYFGIVAEDTFESDPSLDISKGTAAATKLVTEDNARYAIGGFRTEAVLAYQEIFMDEEMLFFGTGASTDIFCQNVLDDYARYKYFFRTMPINSTSLASSLLRYLLYLDGYLTAVTSLNITKVAIIREDLSWTVGMSAFLNGYLPLYNLSIVEEVAFPITAEAADFATYWQQVDAAGAQITVPIISAQGGILMMTQYAQAQPKCLVAGIDVMAQLDTYWTETGGAAQYEVVLQSTLRTNKTTRTIPFWDAFLDAYGGEPLYTAIGAYDAMYGLAAAIDDAQSLVSADIIPHLEAFDTASPFEAAFGNIAFTPSHDVFEGYIGDTIYGVTLFTQWQAGGVKEAVSSGGLIYPDSIVTAPLSLPPWGINP